MTDIKTKLDELKKIRELAAHGPWQIYRRDDDCGLIRYDVEQENMNRICFGVSDLDLPSAKQTSEFIATAANNWNNILDALEIACEALSEMKYTVARSGKLENTPFEDVIELQLQTLSQISEKIGCE